MSSVLQPPTLSPGFLQPLPEINWEKRLNRNLILAKDTLRTGDATFFKTSRAALFASGIDWSNPLKQHLPADLRDTPKPEDLHNLNKDSILEVKNKIQTIRPKIEASIRAGKPQDELFTEIDNDIDDLYKINQELEELRGKLKIVVKKFPTRVAQQQAVNVWQESWNTVQEAVGRIMVALNDIVQPVSRVVAQVLAWAKKAWKTVETVVKDVVEWIESLFD
ncbi:hypothetical protein PRZ48_009030 [Zasmidium cellare]|uniref:Uncharacterized protein n=1 Tax=Zasmidium cellare TaxID=395010 RepID=A0ABR0EI17_ZASCE|nr:hypothetical protein PRZ48_009030 [Zasmidium cellare]